MVARDGRRPTDSDLRAVGGERKFGYISRGLRYTGAACEARAAQTGPRTRGEPFDVNLGCAARSIEPGDGGTQGRIHDRSEIGSTGATDAAGTKRSAERNPSARTTAGRGIELAN